MSTNRNCVFDQTEYESYITSICYHCVKTIEKKVYILLNLRTILLKEKNIFHIKTLLGTILLPDGFPFLKQTLFTNTNDNTNKPNRGERTVQQMKNQLLKVKLADCNLL